MPEKGKSRKKRAIHPEIEHEEPKSGFAALGDSIKENPVVYIVGGAFIVLCALAGLLYNVGVAGKEEAVAAQLAEALKTEDPALRAAELERMADDAGSLTPDVLYLWGETAFDAEDFGKARAAFERLRTEYPESTHTPDAVEGLGFIAENEENYQQALATYKEVIEKWPGSFAGRRQELNIGRCEERLGNLEEAINSYQSQMVVFPGSHVAASAETALSRLEQAHPELFAAAASEAAEGDEPAATGSEEADQAAAPADDASADTAATTEKGNMAGGLPAPNQGGVYVVAHRGAHEGIPENSLAAYEKAIELGADFVEVDVRITKDGDFVSMHNDTVDKYVTDGATGDVADLTLEELRALDIGSRVGPEWAGTRVPTFDEILDVCKDKIGIYLDLKQAPVAPLVEKLKARGMERRVVWYAGAHELAELQDLCPECVGMPDCDEANLPQVLEQKPRVVAPVWRRLSQSYVEKCHEAGAIVIVDEDFSVQDTSCWEQALAWGVDGIQTDRPAELIEFLKSR